MARPLWKGAISFGLVTIPVNVFSATRRDELRFRQLDRRDNSPIREQRVNVETGAEVPWEEVVKGFEYEEGSFVVLDQDDFAKANVKATETIDIVQAVPQGAVPPRVLREAAVRGAGQGRHQAVPHLARDLAAHRQGRGGDHRHARPPASGRAHRRREDHHARTPAVSPRDQGGERTRGRRSPGGARSAGTRKSSSPNSWSRRSTSPGRRSSSATTTATTCSS